MSTSPHPTHPRHDPSPGPSRAQQQRRADAEFLGRKLATTSSSVITNDVEPGIEILLHSIPESVDILATAASIAAAADTDEIVRLGSSAVGRFRRPSPAVIIVHSDTWTLVLRVNRFGLYDVRRSATTWALIDGYGEDSDEPYLAFCFDGDESNGDSWADMVDEIITLTC